MENEGNIDTNCNWCSWNDRKRFGKEAVGVRNQRRARDHPNYNIVLVGKTTKKSPRELRRLAVSLTPMKTLVRKACDTIK